MAKNMWGDLSSLAVIRTPKTILEEQANLLTEATDGMFVGTVEDQPRMNGFHYSLNAVVPALNNYKYEILEVFHPLEIYPISLLSERPKVSVAIKTEEDFEAMVEQVLSSADVRSLLSKLKSQLTKP
jgi:hypothetical protein